MDQEDIALRAENFGLAPYSIDLVCAALDVLNQEIYVFPSHLEDVDVDFIQPDFAALLDMLFAFPDFLAATVKYRNDHLGKY